MAFPVVQTANTKSGTVTSNSTSWTLTYPTNIAAGDLLLAFIGHDGGGNGSSDVGSAWPAGWVAVDGFSNFNGISEVALLVAKKKATGSESGNFTVTLDGPATEQGGWRVFHITGWEGTLGTSLGGGSGGFSDGAVTRSDFNQTAGTASNTPTMLSLDPAAWGTEDTLWVAVMAADTSRTVTAYPTGYSTTSADVSGGAGGATLGIAFYELNAAAHTSPSFTISASDDWVTVSLAIRPAAAASTYSHSGWGIPLNSA